MRAITRVICVSLCCLLLTSAVASAARAQGTEENPRAGRLGGSAGQLDQIYGDAGDSSNDLIVYEPLLEAGANVEFGIFKKKIFEIVITSLDGDDLNAESVARIVGTLSPTDGECDDNHLGDEVYRCHSASLKKAYAKATMNDLGFEGGPGDYHFRTDDEELTIAIGHDEYTEPEPTAIPPTPTPTLEEQLATYVPLPDVRERVIRPAGLVGEKIYFYGTLLSIYVAPPGNVFVIGDGEKIQVEAQMQVTVLAPDGSEEVVSVGYDGDTTEMYEGSYVVVYGEVVGIESFTNGLVGVISQPLVKALLVSL